MEKELATSPQLNKVISSSTYRITNEDRTKFLRISSETSREAITAISSQNTRLPEEITKRLKDPNFISSTKVSEDYIELLEQNPILINEMDRMLKSQGIAMLKSARARSIVLEAFLDSLIEEHGIKRNITEKIGIATVAAIRGKKASSFSTLEGDKLEKVRREIEQAASFFKKDTYLNLTSRNRFIVTQRFIEAEDRVAENQAAKSSQGIIGHNGRKVWVIPRTSAYHTLAGDQIGDRGGWLELNRPLAAQKTAATQKVQANQQLLPAKK